MNQDDEITETLRRILSAGNLREALDVAGLDRRSLQSIVIDSTSEDLGEQVRRHLLPALTAVEVGVAEARVSSLPQRSGLELSGSLTAKTLPRDKVLQALQDMPPGEFQRAIVEPLLRAEGFTDITPWKTELDESGRLVAVRNDLGIPKLYAIQIKRFGAVAGAADIQTIAEALPAITLSLAGSIPDPRGRPGTCSSPDRGMVITPFPLGAEYRLKAEHMIRHECQYTDITILEGNNLLNVLVRSLPPVLAEVCEEYSYSLAVANEANIIKESPAFGVARPLTVDNLYVDIALGASSDPILYCANCRPPQRGTIIIHAPSAEINLLRRMGAAEWNAPHLSMLEDVAASERLRKKLKASMPKIELGREDGETTDQHLARVKKAEEDALNRKWHGSSPNVFKINLDDLVLRAHSSLRDALGALGDLSSREGSATIADAAFQRADEMIRKYARLLRSPILTEHYGGMFRHTASEHSLVPIATLRSRALLFTTINLVVLGPPGGGKTTLLRSLVRDSALSIDSREPLLVDLIGVKTPSLHGLVEACRVSVGRLKRVVSHQSLMNSLRAGSYRVLLDGLDEAGVNASTMVAGIQEFMMAFPMCQVIVTCRDSVYESLSKHLEGTIHLRLSPFSDEDLSEFIGNWFGHAVGSISAVATWLDAHADLKNAARVPMIAALVCGLCEATIENLPESLFDLYEKRLDLLTGRWEEAKGYRALPHDVRLRYTHYLMKLAYRMHMDEMRAIPQAIAEVLAQDYFVREQHRDASGLVRDCLDRGLLASEVVGYVGFQHLTYQEHLAARWLCHQNDIRHIASLLDKPWWWVALDFYARMKMDVTPLIEHVLRDKEASEASVRALVRIIRNADLSEADAVYELESKAQGRVREQA